MDRLAKFLRMPGGSGVALVAVSLPFVLLLPRAGFLVALVMMCLYPIVDVPHILARPSWWRGATISAVVWFVLFCTLVAIVDGVYPRGDDTMAFLYPFLLYPMALAISGFVRLEGRLRGRPRESGPRIARKAVCAAYAFIVIVPLTFASIPLVTWKITGNSPSNTVYSSDGAVVAAAPGQVSIRLTGGETESFHLGLETKFDFRGPGSPMVKGPAGPAWLTPGQRVGVSYVYRDRKAQAERLNIWIDRKGCAGNAKWTAPRSATTPESQAIPSLTGTTWEGRLGMPDEAGRPQITTFEFLQDHRLAYQGLGRGRHTDGLWRQDGAMVLIEVNDCYAEYEGRIEGDDITGQFSNEVGMRDSWTARLTRVPASATTPK